MHIFILLYIIEVRNILNGRYCKQLRYKITASDFPLFKIHNLYSTSFFTGSPSLPGQVRMRKKKNILKPVRLDLGNPLPEIVDSTVS